MDVAASRRPSSWTSRLTAAEGLRSNRYSAPVLSNSSSSGSINRTISSSSSSEGDSKTKRTCSHCHLCGKRLLKLAKWRNYLTLPCRCRHVFCKQCITGRLQCRQRVMSAASFELMWTFPCPGSQQCGQELNVDWSKGRRYSKNLVARDLGSSDDSWEQEEEGEGEEEEEGECGVSLSFDESDVTGGHPHYGSGAGCRLHPSSASPRFEVRKSVSFDL